MDERIDVMFANGFVDEVKGSACKGILAHPAKHVGNRVPGMCPRGEWLNGASEQAKVEMRRVTRIFVRRQANWFKESDPNIKWFKVEDGIDEEIEKYIRQLIDF